MFSVQKPNVGHFAKNETQIVEYYPFSVVKNQTLVILYTAYTYLI